MYLKFIISVRGGHVAPGARKPTNCLSATSSLSLSLSVFLSFSLSLSLYIYIYIYTYIYILGILQTRLKIDKKLYFHTHLVSDIYCWFI
jgi:hypothetical protein